MPPSGRTTSKALLAALMLFSVSGASMSAGIEDTARGAALSCPVCASSVADPAPFISPLLRHEVLDPLPVAIFGEDRRQPIWDLRRRAPGTLSAEEQAIVQAAGRTGTMACGNTGTNGILIQLTDGRDAVLTSAHSFIGMNGPLCDLTTARFMPNVSFHLGGDFEEFTLRLVETDGALPLNHDNADLTPANLAPLGNIPIESDFLVFVLGTNISDDILPDGSTRGFLRMADDIPATGTAYLIGINIHFEGGETPGFEACPYLLQSPAFFHLCATENSTSSSALMVLREGALVLAGTHSGAYKAYGNATAIGTITPTPSSLEAGNIALSMDTVRAYLDSIGQPVVIAPPASTVSPTPTALPSTTEIEL